MAKSRSSIKMGTSMWLHSISIVCNTTDFKWMKIGGPETWWSIAKPDPELMDFHLRHSLFAKCCGSGLIGSEHGEDDDD